ncbi:AzlC family ABC transporter permease [[Eubacterium] hominis]|uniref:AzlC family ABC transporter permease n=1 Tax=[Eubacterium] hominis TaxID=2764325 RepID=UPI003A4DB23B
MEHVQNHFMQGIKDGVPIGLGYVSVSFTFGMMAVSQGIPLEVAVVISLSNLTSAGQFSGLALMVAQASYIELALSQFIINIRYALMSLSLSQKVDKKMTTLERAAISYGVTDEIFALASSTYERVGKNYMAGLILFPVACWTLGTFLGGAASTLLPESIRSALGIAIYGMFLAIIIPPAKKFHSVRVVLMISIIMSCLFTILHQILPISSGFVIILCTVIASALGAWLFPIEEVSE